MQCYKCHTIIEIDHRPRRGDTCPNCRVYLHCCRNCRFFHPTAHNQCREPQAEWVRDKETANFCDFFEAATEAQSSPSTRREDSLKKLDQLFKKK
ncbi:MAG: hypothetical protein ACE5HO_20245 [bacterium]